MAEVDLLQILVNYIKVVSEELKNTSAELKKLSRLKALELERQGVPKDTIDAALDL